MTSMPDLVRDIPDELKPRALRFIERIEGRAESLDDEQRSLLLKVAAVSDFGAGVIHQLNPSDYEDLFSAPSQADIKAFDPRPADAQEAKRMLRRFRNTCLLRLLMAELSSAIETRQTLNLLSALADRTVELACELGRSYIAERLGNLLDTEGNAIPLLVVGMGKLGGRELNFSSDIDLVFLYPTDGQSDGRRSVTAQEYCTRWSQQCVQLLDEATADGFVFRVDTRLRPFGKSGPPVSSFQALEAYLLNHGRDWERYAWVKARVLGEHSVVHDELYDELVRPFVYRRYLDYGIFESLRSMHELISAEVARRDLANNVKLGKGGIREIEFIVQSMQLLRGGSNAALRTQSLFDAMDALSGSTEFDDGVLAELEESYLFLRRLENYIQAMRDRQTHDLPRNEEDKAALAFAMDFANWAGLDAAIKQHRATVSGVFTQLAYRESGDQPANELAALWSANAEEEAWAGALDRAGFRDYDKLAAAVAGFRSELHRAKLAADAEKRLALFLPRLLELVKNCEDVPGTFERCRDVLQQIIRRSAYIALLNENPQTGERLVELCDRSLYIANQIARYPVLLDELLDPRVYSDPPGKQKLQADISGQLDDINDGDSEQATELLARFQRTNMFRVAVADISGKLPLMKVSDSLTYLAEVVLENALQIAWNDLAAKHGHPCFNAGEGTQAAGFCIIAYGKLGGLELSYGSDLDIVFLHNSRGDQQQTDGDSPVDNAVFFSRLVRRLVHILTTRTASGVLYEIDTRLRPSGRSGLLVTSVDAFEKYQREDAWTWEHQAILRARAVAGDPALAEEFSQVRSKILSDAVSRDDLKEKVLEMRRKMRAALDHSSTDRFDLKQGKGGIGDIEFIVQYLVLLHAAEHPLTYEYSDNIRQLDALASGQILDVNDVSRMQDIYRRYRQEIHHRTLNQADKLVANDRLKVEREYVLGSWKRVFGEPV